MKKLILIFAGCVLLTSCGDDNDDNIPLNFNVAFKFTHNWDGDEVTDETFNTIQYTTEHGEELSIEKLRYLISNIVFHKSDGSNIVLEGYNLVDVGANSGLIYLPDGKIPEGKYTNVSFTFGFDNEDNIDGNYTDLNSVLWNVPEMLGGGYHYMQLEGKFIAETMLETGYQFHAIRAVDISSTPPKFEDTFFTVDLGEVTISNHAEIEIKMNVAAWFKNPNTWNLNELHAMLMPNFEAQVMISENGKDVFSLGEIVQ